MTHVLFVTQVIDADDPTLGFVASWIDALAERAEGVTAIGNEVRGTPAFGSNVRVVSLGKERGAGRAARGFALQRAVATSGGHRPVLLAHMCPIYLDITAPVTTARRVPTMLWFAHPSVTPELRLAERLSDVVLTSLPGAYPRPGPKVRVVGQATDTERIVFDPRAERDPGPLRLVAIGRTSPSKGFDRAIRALAKARAEGVEATLRIVGPSTTEQECAHATELRDLATATGLGSNVTFEPGVAPKQVDGIVRSADVLVNAMVSGSGDKVVFEAMAAGTVPLVANPAFRPLLSGLPIDLAFDRDDEAMLAGRIVTLSSADPAEMDRTRHTLRERVEAQHSLRGWAQRVVEIAEGLR
jgi:glycosyltransferase involved in cell wall biosynthesis